MSEAIKVLCDGAGRLAVENQQLRALLQEALPYLETVDCAIETQLKIKAALEEIP